MVDTSLGWEVSDIKMMSLASAYWPPPPPLPTGALGAATTGAVFM